jgi:peptidoglycan/xylan/chitin deacetylase (PgdA/CDA1 family)
MVLVSCPNGSNDDEPYGTVPGVVLGFDDYSPRSWEQHFDLFDRYGVKVTFFCVANVVTDFMLNAQNRGHEIAYHTISHPHLPEVSREQFFEQTISRINVFNEGGIELTTFAYPYGDYQMWMNDELLKYYKVVRGFSGSRNFTLEEMRYGFVDSRSIDNITYSSKFAFNNMIDSILLMTKRRKTIAVLTSHQINSEDWGITTERLEYVLKKGKEIGLKFYTYKDLQNWE